MKDKSKLVRKLISVTLVLCVLISGLISVMPMASAYSSEQAAITNTGTSSNSDAPAFSWDNASVYFLMTDRFYNGDTSNDHSYNRGLDAAGNEVYLDPMSTGQASFQGGDFAGVTQKINEGYFTDLGINAIWISAPYEQVHGYVVGYDHGSDQFPHYGYHGYYSNDYTETDKNFGTKEDFQTLVDTAHENGIRIVLDVVINHSGYHSMYDMNEYGFGSLNSGWDDYYFSMNNFSNGAYNSKINFSSSSPWELWWGSEWIRSSLPGHSTGGGDVYMNLAGLPDFKTGDTNQVGIPEFLQTKWTQEGTYDDKIELYGERNTVSGYLIDWITQWVRDYGVDGFRVDTVKHVEIDVLNRLSQSATQALREWKAENPEKALDDLDFWMTGEHWDHGVGKSNYFNNGFDSMINFDLQKGFPSASSAEGTFSYYANTLNNDPNFNVLSYASSHDTYLMRGNDIHTGSVLMMMPGGIEIFYGDETSRPTIGLAPGAGTTPGHHLRSFMNWDTANEAVLEHWQKVGSFRNNHLSIGAGSHKQITGYNGSTGYTFSRTYNDGENQDEVVVTLFAPNNKDIEVNVSSIFADGEEVVNAYDESTAIVQNGKVTFNSGKNGTILVESPRSSISLSLTGDKEFEGTQELRVKLSGAENATITVDNEEPFTVVDGDTFTIGAKTALGGFVNVTATAFNTEDTVTKEYTYEKIDPNAVTTVYFDNSEMNWSNVNIHYWNSTSDSTKWPGEPMTIDGDTAEFTFPRGTEYKYVIFNTNNGATQTADLTFNEDKPLFVINKNSGPKYTGTWEEMIEPLEEVKETTINEINALFNSYDEDDYREAEYQELTAVKDNAIIEIESATTVDQVNSIKAETLSAFEEINELAYTVNDAKNELRSLKYEFLALEDEDFDFSNGYPSDIMRAYDLAILELNTLTNVEDIEKLIDDTRAEMEAIVANEISILRRNAKAAIEDSFNTIDADKLTAKEYEELEKVKDDAIAKIDNDTTGTEMDNTVADATAQMQEIYDNSLNVTSESAIEEIEAVYADFDETTITAEEYSEITDIKTSALEDINSATTAQSVNGIKNEAIESMNNIYNNSILPARATAIEELETAFNSYVDDDYNEYGYNELLAIKTNAIEDINNATTLEDVNSIKTTALNDFEESNELTLYKNASMQELNDYYAKLDMEDISNGGKVELEDIKTNSYTELYSATSQAQVDATVEKYILEVEEFLIDELKEERAAAKQELETAFDAIDSDKMTASEYAEILAIKETAIEDIDSDLSSIEMAVTVDKATAQMQEIFDNSLYTEIEKAIEEINNAFNAYDKSEFTTEDYATITNIKNNAIEDLNSATTQSQIDKIVDDAIIAMSEVSSVIVMYFDNSEIKWSNVYAYWWGSEETVKWPGEKMQADGDMYYIKIPSDAKNIIFSNGSNTGQTVDLTVNKNTPVFVINTYKSGTKYNGTFKEVDKDLNEVKDLAIDEINTLFSSYARENYTDEEYDELFNIKTKAIEDIDNATTFTEVNSIKTTAINELTQKESEAIIHVKNDAKNELRSLKYEFLALEDEDFDFSNGYPSDIMRAYDLAILELNTLTNVEDIEKLIDDTRAEMEAIVANEISILRRNAKAAIEDSFNTIDADKLTAKEYEELEKVKDDAIAKIDNDTTGTEMDNTVAVATAQMQEIYDNSLYFITESAIEEINNAYNAYDESKFTSEEYEELTSIKTQAINDINTATTSNEITAIKNDAIADMNNVAENSIYLLKEEAVKEINNAFNTYDESEFSTEDYAKITSIKDNAIEELNSATTKAQVDSIVDDTINAMSEVGDFIVIYFDNSEIKWNNVYAYWWGSTQPTRWPGEKMEKNGDMYSIKIPSDAKNIIFSNGYNTSQTIDLKVDKSTPVFNINTYRSGSKYGGTWEEK